MARQLWIVRHGSVPADCAGRFWGRTDLPLGAEGERQAAALAAFLRGAGFARCVHSPLKRAASTARIIADHLGIELHADSDLREIDFGTWEGKTFAQIQQEHPTDVDQWAQFAPEFAFPGGEALGGFLSRMRSVTARLAGMNDERVLAITHGGVSRAMICELLGLPQRNYVLFEVRCGRAARVELFEGRGVLSGLNLGPEEEL